MDDFFEIDFLPVETKKSGDAIALRYRINDVTSVHVVDGGFSETGEAVVSHLRRYFGTDVVVDRVVLTHPDGDHARGLRYVLENMVVRELWMLRPWEYAEELLPKFARYTSVAGLSAKLKEIYFNTAALEEIAVRRGIPIREPFQGASVGPFIVLAPTKARYLDLVADSEKTPETSEDHDETLAERAVSLIGRAINWIRLNWGDEKFSAEETSAENEMSVIQYAAIAGQKILLTGDAGRGALAEAANYAPAIGLNLPGIDRFQVPHHGSRRNVSTELLDRWLGSRLAAPLPEGQGNFSALISSAKEDEHHPRKAVIRALKHRGARVHKTEGMTLRTSKGAPEREGWVTAADHPYPDDQED